MRGEACGAPASSQKALACAGYGSLLPWPLRFLRQTLASVKSPRKQVGPPLPYSFSLNAELCRREAWTGIQKRTTTPSPSKGILGRLLCFSEPPKNRDGDH